MAFVQGAHNSVSASSASLTATFGSGVTSGNTVWGIVAWNATSGAPTSVTVGGVSATILDTVSDVADAASASTFILGNISGSPTSVVANFSPNQAFISLVAIEESGCLAATNPTDVHTGRLQSSPGTGANIINSGNVTTTVANDIIVGAYCDAVGSTVGTAGTSPLAFTLRTTETALGEPVATEDGIVLVTPGTAASTFGQNANDSALSFVIAIKPSASTANPFVSKITDLPPRGYVYSKWSEWVEAGNNLPPLRNLTKPFLQSDYPNPRDFQRSSSYAWTELGNNLPPLRDLTQPSPQRDFPNPYPVTWYRSLEVSGNALTSVTHNPFFQTDWPNPQRITWYQTWTQRFNLTNPFNQSDWSNPRTYIPIQQTWIQSLNLFYQSETFPFVQSDYPNPQRIVWYKDWSINLLENTLAPAFQSPFNQFDWPLSRTYQPIDQFWQNNLRLLPQPTPFFQNVDFPLPVVNQPIDQTWLQNLLLFFQSNTFPFSQTDWKNPYPIYWFRDYNQNLVIYLPVGTKPFLQSDWPLTGFPRPIDQFFYQSLVLNLPEPPLPPAVISSGRQITEAEVMAEVAQWWKKQESASMVTGSEFAKLGAIKGGIARMKSLTPKQLTTFQREAANIRWQYPKK
jgi:hypothetical protein